MNITEAIESRRSIRNFKDTPVPEDILRRLADAGRLAPSASNLQAWKFFFVTEPDLVAKWTCSVPDSAAIRPSSW